MSGDSAVVSVTFIEHDGTTHVVSAEAGKSLMQAAVDNMMPGINADCGGNCSCATCVCYVDSAWMKKLAAPSEDEQLMLEGTVDPRPTSRLACQIKLTGELEGMRVELPEPY